MNTVKIYISLPGGRDSAVMILARNGYTVRQGKEKKGKTYDRYVEFWKEEESGKAGIVNVGDAGADSGN